ncbi:BTAD domain-containing putative transcriptional regulator [Nonomuraea typhae]|uniref:BTAD domain-containing putative transcriptional regulator n=1 Tax=Nonomuraea typhae TaxID=2603600 RepID=UPI0012FBB9E4|nr:BTAD domain-containing putative transcriptional regulator [Nonomuraea typhae]
MRFGVLGPLAVWSGEGEPIRVPEVMVRTLLARLLVDPGRPVSADRLAADLWGEDQPASPANSLQGKVSQLRRALGGRDVVVYGPAGYHLRAEPDAVDAGRFTALLTEARAIADARRRAGKLTAALALWRGPAFADVADEPFAAPAIARLEEQRLAALEEQAEARLLLGEHRALAAELAAPAAAHPLRERLRAAHMKALYLSGRQSEALAAYAGLRERLRDELGLDPGPEVAALHQAILEHAPHLRVPVPISPSELIGRDHEVAQVCAALGSARLVTLTGPGGVGKTRLALAAAEGVEGAFVVELAGRHRPGGDGVAEVAESVAAALGIRDDVTAPVAERLVGALRARRPLLVLDNCEHLVEAVAELTGTLLREAPGVRVLATSREPLALTGEVLLAVPPLPVPAPDAGLDTMRRAGAVRLFAARAAASAPGFTLDEGNAAAVAAICRRLDGIPLALELAATRVRALGVQGLADRLDDRFRLLATGRRDAPARQRTLRAMIDWSWELLGEPERVVLRRLAVHADGCTLEAAEAVCAGGEVAAADVLDLLSRLVDRSLVVTAGGTRYRLLESVAAYCLERLREAGESGPVRRRRDEHYADLAERAEPYLRGGDQRRWLSRLDEEAANLRNVLEEALQRGAAGPALRLVNALAWYWYLRGRHREAHRASGAVLELVTDGRALAWHTGFALLTEDGEGRRERADRALDLLAGDPAAHAMAAWFMAWTHLGFGDLGASEKLGEPALAGFAATGEAWGLAAARALQAQHATFRGDLAALERHGADSAERFGRLGDRWGLVQIGESLGFLAEINGDYERAAALHAEGVRIAEEMGLVLDVSFRLSGLGRIAMLTGDYAAANRHHERALRVAEEQSHTFGVQFAEVGLGMVARRQGRLDAAERYLSRWLAWTRELGADYAVALLLAELGFVAELRGDAVRAMALHEEGLAAAIPSGDPRARALALEGLAGAHSLAGAREKAVALLAEAAALRESAGAPLPPAERGDVDRISARVHP